MNRSGRLLLALGAALLAFSPATPAGATPARRPAAVAQESGVGQTATVKITSEGFSPSLVRLRRRVPARLTFVRETADTCATEIKVEELDLHVALPLNQPVTVEFTPSRTGKFDFGCGNGAFRAALVIQ